jgi:Ni,Fe-hydrogenase I cytochrome b subunit
MSDAVYDVRQEQYPTVIREMIRHEDDVTNHRIMWLLIGQGFIANAYVLGNSKGTSSVLVLSVVGLLVTLSAFVMLYRSYQARGYLQFLGNRAKQGMLREEHLPLMGWPRKRIKGWWGKVWISRWIRQAGDVLEPWLFLPYLFICMWLAVLMQHLTGLSVAVDLILAAILTTVILSVCCIALVWSQGKDEDRTEERDMASRTDSNREAVE